MQPRRAKSSVVRDWTKTEDYQEKNFAREALTVNPAKACQPLGAVFVANGFDKTLTFVHGSQGCVAYYRSHFSRHFKEPTSCVSSSMTEDAAVFGGLNNMVDGLANAYSLYKPDDDRRLHHLHGRGDRRRPERLHQDRQGKGQRARRVRRAVRAHPGLRRQPHHRLRQRAAGRAAALLGRQGRHRRRSCACRTRGSTSSAASTASSSAT